MWGGGWLKNFAGAAALAVLALAFAAPAGAAKHQAKPKLEPANTIEGALERSPLRQGEESEKAASTVGGLRIERQLAALFQSRGVAGLTPEMIRGLALAQIKTGTPAGVLAGISQREFSHDTVRVPGSIPGTVSSGGYFTAFAFKPASWDYYKYELWGDRADAHNPFNYSDAAMVAGAILQHGSLQAYNSNYAADVLKDAHGKYASPLWGRLIRNLRALQRSGKLEVPRRVGISSDDLLFRAIKMRVELFFSGIPQATG